MRDRGATDPLIQQRQPGRFANKSATLAKWLTIDDCHELNVLQCGGSEDGGGRSRPTPAIARSRYVQELRSDLSVRFQSEARSDVAGRRCARRDSRGHWMFGRQSIR
jgi:hypothetical protein